MDHAGDERLFYGGHFSHYYHKSTNSRLHYSDTDLAALKSEAHDTAKCVASVLDVDYSSLTFNQLVTALAGRWAEIEKQLPFASSLFRQLLQRMCSCFRDNVACEDIGAAFVVLGALQTALFLPRESLDPQVVLRLQVDNLRAEVSAEHRDLTFLERAQRSDPLGESMEI